MCGLWSGILQFFADTVDAEDGVAYAVVEAHNDHHDGRGEGGSRRRDFLLDNALYSGFNE